MIFISKTEWYYLMLILYNDNNYKKTLILKQVVYCTHVTDVKLRYGDVIKTLGVDDVTLF